MNGYILELFEESLARENMIMVPPDMDKDSEHLFHKIKDKILDKKNVLIHGPAGTGKSYQLRYIHYALGNCIMCAPTGVAAINMRDLYDKSVGRTLHEFFALGIHSLDIDSSIKKLRSKSQVKLIKAARVLVIDEISMVGAGILDTVDQIMRHYGVRDKPFGGIPVLFCGDFYQLPPVKDKWAFQSKVWKELDLHLVETNKPKRFVDQKYFSMLNAIRVNRIYSSHYKMLLSRAIDSKKKKELLKSEIVPTLLFSLRKTVDDYNEKQLAALPDKEYEYLAEDLVIYRGTVSKRKSTSYDNCIAPERIVLKKGAQVMLTRNMLKEDLYNGSRGVVVGFAENDYPIIKFSNGVEKIISLYDNDYIMNNKTYIRRQLPLILAWAITIHKMQGCTIDSLICQLDSSVFEAGQAYVGMGRCKSFENLWLLDFKLSSIKVSTGIDKILDQLKKD